MNKQFIGIIIVAVFVLAMVVFGIKKVTPEIEQPSEDLINTPQPEEGKIP